MSKITFCLTLYKPNEDDLIYWQKTSKYLVDNGYPFFVINDNPKKEIENFYKKVKIINNVNNIGKFESIYNFLKSTEFNTSHIKIIDPDDRIDIEKLLKFKICSEGIIVMDNILLKDGEIKKIKQNSLGTAWTILPISSIKNDEYYKKINAKIGNWLEDQALGIIAYINGSKITRTNLSWYIYSSQTGMTNHLTKNDVDEIIESLISIDNLFIVSNQEPKTGFPGKLNYIKRLINESTLNNKEEIIRKISKFERDIKIIE